MEEMIDSMVAAASPAENEKVIPRETPEPDPARAANVKAWQDRIMAAERHWGDDFKRMREDMDLAMTGQHPGWDSAQQYTANIILKHVNDKTASLYAKSPRAVAKRRQRLESAIWDGTVEAIQEAQMMAQSPDLAVQQQGVIVMQEAQRVIADRKMLDRMAKTLEILFHYSLDEQHFKKQAKQLVRRTITCGVGYVELHYQRIMEKQPHITARIGDVTSRLDLLERLTADMADGELENESAEMEELRTTLATLQAEEEIVAQEGVVFDFPYSDEVIPCTKTRQLGDWSRTTFIVRKMTKTPDEIKESFGKDIGTAYTGYKPTNDEQRASLEGEDAATKAKGLVLVWYVWDKRTGNVFAICDGYPDYLKEPAAPDVQVDGFFNIIALVFNQHEHKSKVYPRSDVSLLQPMQEEHNRAREALREHRIASRPRWATFKGTLEDDDAAQLSGQAAHSVVLLNGLGPESDIEKILQRVPTAGIDQALYDTTPVFDDIQRVTGRQEANFGSMSGGSATESSIAEGSRIASVNSNIDDMDDFLSEVARMFQQIALGNMGEETVKRIVGPGAVWPKLSGQEIADELMLTVQAGSSGRPNKAQELANFERGAPILLQIPGISPTWFGRKAIEKLDDDTLDLDEALIEGIPSMTAMNSMAGKPSQPGTGDPGNNPDQQGQNGGQNAPSTQQNEPGPQPEYTPPV